MALRTRPALLAWMTLALGCAGPSGVADPTRGSSDGTTGDGTSSGRPDDAGSTTHASLDSGPGSTSGSTSSGPGTSSGGTASETLGETTQGDGDGDRDGYPAPADCDDGDPDVHPGAPERCNDVDDDCDPATGEDGVASVDGQGSYPTIGAAVAASAPGAVIRVCAGTWPENVVIAHDLWLEAPAGAAATVIDGSGLDPAVAVDAGEVTLSGFTLTGGTSVGQGGGLSVFGSDRVTLESCIVTNNTSTDGAGIYTYGAAQLALVDTTVSGNTGGIGGGIAMNGDGLASSLTMTGCTVADNVADEAGAGLVLFQVPSVQIEATSIVDNASLDGGGMIVGGSSITLTSSAVLRNSATGAGGGVLLYAGLGELVSIDSDWGTGADDNVPTDVTIPGIGTWAAYGAGASFDCTVIGCS